MFIQFSTCLNNTFALTVPDKVLEGIAHNCEILIDICFKINRSATMMLVATNGHIKWNLPTLKQLFISVTNYKNKMGKGILSSFQNYDQVSPV